MAVRKVITEEEKEKYLSAFNRLYNADKSEKEIKYLGILLTFNIDTNDQRFCNCIEYDKFFNLPEESEVIMRGFITDMSLQKSKKGKMYGLFEITDEKYNTFSVMTGDKTYLGLESQIKNGDLVLFQGKKLDNSKISLNKENMYKM